MKPNSILNLIALTCACAGTVLADGVVVGDTLTVTGDGYTQKDNFESSIEIIDIQSGTLSIEKEYPNSSYPQPDTRTVNIAEGAALHIHSDEEQRTTGLQMGGSGDVILYGAGQGMPGIVEMTATNGAGSLYTDGNELTFTNLTFNGLHIYTKVATTINLNNVTLTQGIHMSFGNQADTTFNVSNLTFHADRWPDGSMYIKPAGVNYGYKATVNYQDSLTFVMGMTIDEFYGSDNKGTLEIERFNEIYDYSGVNELNLQFTDGTESFDSFTFTEIDFGGSGYLDVATFTRYIPEPSTATMSLLALAGLLARRRRKAA